ncbi:ricin B-like lectin R40G3 [Nymphaea colorata]|nr:ricin B-like lectin R40G3 [Nymphaea colorata]
MEFPFGHHGRHQHHRREEEEEEEQYRRYPDPRREDLYDGPPPPSQFAPPAQFSGPPPEFACPPPIDSDYHRPQGTGPFDYGYLPQPPPPPAPYESSYPEGYARVEHVGHEESRPAPETYPSATTHHESHHRFPFIHRHEKEEEEAVESPQGQTVRVFCQAETEYSMTIRDGSVVLAPTNPDDPYQHWIKDEKYSTRVKDQDGFPSFALVNKATGQALQHSVGETQPVRLTRYDPDQLDQSVLWTLSKDLGQGFRSFRMVNNIKLNLDAFNGDKKHGGVKDGTVVVLWSRGKGDNQRWKVVPY